jgi:K+-transporting ATPase ATPase A chain
LQHTFLLHHPSVDWAVQPANWLNNPNYHGFSEILYEYTSSNANNGSGFEGLGDNNIWWNVSTGIALILGRYLPSLGLLLLQVCCQTKNISLNPQVRLNPIHSRLEL